MLMKRMAPLLLAGCGALVACAAVTVAAEQPLPSVRLNRAIELLAQNKPIFRLISTNRSMENARAVGASDADFVIIDMEHVALDFERLQMFLLGVTNKAEIARKGSLQPNILTFPLNVPAWSIEPLRAAPAPTNQQTPSRLPDVIYVATPADVVDAMLKVANVKATDVLYDLGCGDGRIVITAAKEYGARGVGFDIDPQRIKEATASAQQAGVADRVRFVEADLFEANISEASVVTVYLLSSLNLKLRPKLMRELKPGTRVVSHAFDMGDWKPERELNVNGRRVFLWTIPKQ